MPGSSKLLVRVPVFPEFLPRQRRLRKQPFFAFCKILYLYASMPAGVFWPMLSPCGLSRFAADRVPVLLRPDLYVPYFRSTVSAGVPFGFTLRDEK